MKTRGKTFAEINITPLTDIFLVLLIIMMITAPMIDIKGLNLAVLTVGPPQDSNEKPKSIMVEINSQGEYTVASQNITHDELLTNLQKLAPDNPDGVIIETHPDATHESITFAIATVEEAGITKVALIQKEEKAKEVLPPSAKKHK
jgi:biopolymer transport protein ExbD